MDTNDIKNFLIDNNEIFDTNDAIINALRYIGWAIIKFIILCADTCRELYDYSFGLLDFTTWGNVNSFVAEFKPLLVFLLTVSIFALGVIFILNHEKKPKIIINICLAVLCVTCSTVVFYQLNTMTLAIKSGVDNIQIEGKKFNGVYNIVTENMIDIVALDQKIGMKNIDYDKEKKSVARAEINKDNIEYINYGEVMNPNSKIKWKDKGGAEDILNTKLIPILVMPGNEIYETDSIYNGFGINSDNDTDFLNQFYYRYHFDFFTAILQLAAIIILYVAMSYKCIRIIFELVVARLLAYLFSAELSGGQKLAKTLVFIRDNYILLIITTLCIRIFYLMNSFLQATVDNVIVQGILILFVAFCVIDGPNLVEKLLGVDVGLKQSTARFIAAGAAVKGAMHVAAAPFRMFMDGKKQDKLADKINQGNKNGNEDFDKKQGQENNEKDMNKDNQNDPGKNSNAETKSGGFNETGNNDSSGSGQSFMDNQANSDAKTSFMDSQAKEAKSTFKNQTSKYTGDIMKGDKNK